MAFTTVAGAAGSPDSFFGTDGVDTISLTALPSGAWLGARQSGDRITLNGAGSAARSFTLNTGAGNDTLGYADATAFEAGQLFADPGRDTLNLAAVASSTIAGGQGGDQISTAGLVLASRINGNQGNDLITIAAGASDSEIFGGVEDDTITLTTALTTSLMQANEGDDAITITAGTSLERSTINGNQGNDLFSIAAASSDSFTTIFGGDGNDTLNAANSLAQLILAGDAGDDSLVSAGSSDTLFSGTGNDTLQSGSGNDSLVSTAGTDRLTGGLGDDTFSVSNGVNTVITDFASIGDNANVLIANGGSLRAVVGREATFVATAATSNTGAAVELELVTLGGVTTVDMTLATGSSGYLIDIANIGGAGRATGSNFADTISGFNGADSLTGGGGRDRLAGAANGDVMNGGAEADEFFTGFGDQMVYSAGVAGELETFSGALANGDLDILRDFNTFTMSISGFGVAGAGEFSATADGNNFASYADALAGANAAIAATNNDYVLSAFGAGGAWTAVLFIDIGAAAGGGAAAGAIQIGISGFYVNEAAALDAVIAAAILA